MVIEKVLNEELIIVNNWTHKNFLFFNKRKTEVVMFGTDARISQVSCLRYLKSQASTFTIVLTGTLSLVGHLSTAAQQLSRSDVDWWCNFWDFDDD